MPVFAIDIQTHIIVGSGENPPHALADAQSVFIDMDEGYVRFAACTDAAAIVFRNYGVFEESDFHKDGYGELDVPQFIAGNPWWHPANADFF